MANPSSWDLLNTIVGNTSGLTGFATAQYEVGNSAPIQVTIPSGTQSIGIKVIITTTQDCILFGNSNSLTNAFDGTGTGFPLFNGNSATIDVNSSSTLWLISTTPSSGQIAFLVFAGA